MRPGQTGLIEPIDDETCRELVPALDGIGPRAGFRRSRQRLMFQPIAERQRGKSFAIGASLFQTRAQGKTGFDPRVGCSCGIFRRAPQCGQIRLADERRIEHREPAQRSKAHGRIGGQRSIAGARLLQLAQYNESAREAEMRLRRAGAQVQRTAIRFRSLRPQIEILANRTEVLLRGVMIRIEGKDRLQTGTRTFEVAESNIDDCQRVNRPQVSRCGSSGPAVEIARLLKPPLRVTRGGGVQECGQVMALSGIYTVTLYRRLWAEYSSPEDR
jgi:hypothetical protein